MLNGSVSVKGQNELMKNYFIFLIVVFCAFPALGAQSYGAVSVAKVISVYDGDSFKVDIEGYPEIIGKSIGVRVNGIDTPEIKGKCDAEKKLALKAKKITEILLLNAKKIVLTEMKRGKYFRIVADVNIDGNNLGEVLVQEGVALPYSGGKKTHKWCNAH